MSLLSIHGEMRVSNVCACISISSLNYLHASIHITAFEIFIATVAAQHSGKKDGKIFHQKHQRNKWNYAMHSKSKSARNSKFHYKTIPACYMSLLHCFSWEWVAVSSSPETILLARERGIIYVYFHYYQAHLSQGFLQHLNSKLSGSSR